MKYYTDNLLLAYLIKALNEVLAAYPLPKGSGKITVQQKQQPRQQGVPSGPTVFVEKLFDKAYGFQINNLEYQQATDDFKETETQWYETTFQLSTLVVQDPANIELLTASDLVNLVRGLFQSRAFVRKIFSDSIGVLRVTEVRNTYFTDDRNRQEAHPSFDIVLTYMRQLAPLHVPKVQSVTTGIYPV